MGSTAPRPLHPDRPARVGSFLIEGELARGGQGVVWRGVHVKDGRAGAIKLLHDHDPESRRRFLQEAELLRRLKHPNLPRVYEVGEHAGLPYLAMELVEGEDLRRLVARYGPPDPDWIRDVLAHVARTLASCHAQGVVHRDLKPANVVIENHSGRPVLIDLGLAKRDPARLRITALEFERLTETGVLLGTPTYMAPEQIDPGAFGPVGPQADVYALGGLLYFLLTGRSPFPGESPVSVFAAVLAQPAPDPGQEAPADLRRLCLQALAKHPAQRPDGAQAFASELTAATPRGRWTLRVSLAVAGVGVVLAAAIAFVGLDRRPALSESGPSAAPSSPLSTPTPSGPDLLPLVERGVRQLEEGRYEAAEATAERIIERDPSSPDGWEMLGTALAGQDDLPGALTALDRAVALASGLSFPSLKRSQVRIGLGDVRGAREDLERALDLSPDDPRILEASASLCIAHEKRYDEGLAQAERLVARFPERPLGWELLGAACAWRGDLERAESAYRTAMDLSPGRAEPLVGLSLVKQDFGQLDEAYALAVQAHELDPTWKATLGLASVAVRQGRLELARDLLEEWIGSQPHELGAWLLLAHVRRELGDLSRSYDAAVRACELSPHWSQPWLERGKTAYRLGDYEEALSCAERALERGERVAHMLAAKAHFARREADQALKSAELALEADPRLYEAHFYLGMVWGQRQDAGRVRLHMQRVIELAPDSGVADLARQALSTLPPQSPGD